MNNATQTYEFETVGDSTIRETWRATIPADLGGDDVAHRLEEELEGGHCEFVSESNEEERNRELVEGSAEPVPAEPTFAEGGGPAIVFNDQVRLPGDGKFYTWFSPEQVHDLREQAAHVFALYEEGADVGNAIQALGVAAKVER